MPNRLLAPRMRGDAGDGEVDFDKAFGITHASTIGAFVHLLAARGHPAEGFVHTITITGSSGTISRNTTVQLIVN